MHASSSTKVIVDAGAWVRLKLGHGYEAVVTTNELNAALRHVLAVESRFCVLVLGSTLPQKPWIDIGQPMHLIQTRPVRREVDHSIWIARKKLVAEVAFDTMIRNDACNACAVNGCISVDHDHPRGDQIDTSRISIVHEFINTLTNEVRTYPESFALFQRLRRRLRKVATLNTIVDRPNFPRQSDGRGPKMSLAAAEEYARGKRYLYAPAP